MLFYTLSRLKGTTEESRYHQRLGHNSVRGRQHYCDYHNVRVPVGYVGVENHSSLLLSAVSPLLLFL